MKPCEGLAQQLREQLTSSFGVSQVNDVCVVSTPFTVPDNRRIEIVLEALTSGAVLVSDDGLGHHYARMAGVSSSLLGRESAKVSERYGVDASHGEVFIESQINDLLRAITRVIQSSQLIAETVEQRKLGSSKSRFARDVETELILRHRTYERNVKMMGEVKPVPVDYNVLPTDLAGQVSMFTIPSNINTHKADAIPFRIGQVSHRDMLQGRSGSVAVIYDDEDPNNWRVSDALKGIRPTGVLVIPLSDKQSLDQLLLPAA